MALIGVANIDGVAGVRNVGKSNKQKAEITRM